jgi:hypothetical protein
LRQSALADLGFCGRLRHLSRSQAAGVLAQVRLTDHADVQVEKLSSGLARRLAFGRAILRTPQALLLAEPFAPLRTDRIGAAPVSQRLLSSRSQLPRQHAARQGGGSLHPEQVYRAAQGSSGRTDPLEQIGRAHVGPAARLLHDPQNLRHSRPRSYLLPLPVAVCPFFVEMCPSISYTEKAAMLRRGSGNPLPCLSSSAVGCSPSRLGWCWAVFSRVRKRSPAGWGSWWCCSVARCCWLFCRSTCLPLSSRCFHGCPQCPGRGLHAGASGEVPGARLWPSLGTVIAVSAALYALVIWRGRRSDC